MYTVYLSAGGALYMLYSQSSHGDLNPNTQSRFLERANGMKEKVMRERARAVYSLFRGLIIVFLLYALEAGPERL